MSKHHLRHDKICANCGHLVEQRFCSACGQENTETRQSFGHLIHHFFEDLTHYDGAFWRTMKYLLLRPAYLTKQYLAGKRSSFVPPVRLYIFISFVTFLLPHLLPEGHSEKIIKVGDLPLPSKDSIERAVRGAPVATKDTVVRFKFGNKSFGSLKELDSFQRAAPEEQRLSWLGHWMLKRIMLLRQKRGKEVYQQIGHNLSSNFPKSLFVYMPLFALVIWLFHGKRRWMYFDHAIFTLHYFAFMMLLISMKQLIDFPFDYWGGSDMGNAISFFTGLTVIIWSIYYFFRSHHKMYEEHRGISILKAWPIFILNTILLFVVMIGVLLVSIATVH